ncbi:hypothetical protein V1264_021764 [Littorina saxatilis]|uniref:Uncharacterized protein n=2 Tax=Littorina saxatilis TaxID=31220 RepID=A0AAN9FY94_9CAEN
MTMFNNNNYLPDLNHYPPTGQLSPPAPNFPPQEPVPPVQTGFGVVRTSGNFRFLSPTQVTCGPQWAPPTCNMGLVSAPGMGASWQHSVPSTMPWANPTAPHFNAQSTPSHSQTLPVYSMQMTVTRPQTTMIQTSPKPSLLPRPMKRHLQPTPAELTDGPSSKRYLSEKMAACFKQLQISPLEEQNGSNSFNVSDSGDPGFTWTADKGWQRFREVEKRLEVDLQLVEDASMAVEDKLGCVELPQQQEECVLTIPLELKKEANKCHTVLPEAIVKSITNPCTDLVLYTPPEEVIASSLTELSTSSSSHVTSASSSNASAVDSQAATVTSWPQNSSSDTFMFHSGSKPL